jgi:hypothetical protein
MNLLSTQSWENLLISIPPSPDRLWRRSFGNYTNMKTHIIPVLEFDSPLFVEFDGPIILTDPRSAAIAGYAGMPSAPY